MAVYLAALDQIPGDASYDTFSPAIERICQTLLVRGGVKLLDLYQQVALLTLIEQREQRAQARRLPSSIRSQQIVEFSRVINEIQSNPSGFYDFSKDLFVKDLTLCTQRMLPGGAQVFEPGSGVPRKLLFTGGLGQTLKGLKLFVLKHHTFGSLIQIHTSNKSLHEFTPDGWNRCYARCADYLELHPEALGMFGMSWFYDPCLAAISPRLSYLREIPVQGGAAIFKMEASASALRDSTSKSASRKKLFDEGKYLPTNYLMIWLRADLIAWTRKHRTEGAKL